MRESRSSGSVEGVMREHDSYSDRPNDGKRGWILQSRPLISNTQSRARPAEHRERTSQCGTALQSDRTSSGGSRSVG
jgi:hypothetical protein